MVRRPYAPGMRAKKRKSVLTEYGKELREKQKLKNWYGLRERQFKNYIKEVFKRQGGKEDIANLLIVKLESRLDNVVFRLGFASSRAQARQFVGHGHFLVNDKKVNIPSYQLKKGDRVSLSEKAKTKPAFKNISSDLKKQKLPAWLKINLDKLEGEIAGEPSIVETVPPAEISSIFEFYSR